MRTSRRAGIAIAVALASLVVATVAGATTPGPDTPVASQPMPGSHDPSGPGMTCAITNPECDDAGLGGDNPQVVEPRPGMDNVNPTAFDTATVGDDDRTVTIVFWSGVEPCAVLDHIDVDDGTDAVTITLFQGSDPNAGNVACIEIAVQKQVTISLAEPLAGRAIVDGAA
jgi:hypothetical protein